MLGRFVRNIRHKPKHVRDKYALVIALGLTGTIVIFWILTLPGQLASMDQSVSDVADEPVFSSFMSEITTGLSDITEAVSEIRESTDQPVDITSMGSSTASTTESVEVAPSEVVTSSESVRTIRIATTSASTTQ